MHGACTIGIGSKLDAGSHCTVLNEKAHLSPSSLTNHDAPWSGIGLPRAMTVVEGLRRLGNGPDPMKRGQFRDSHNARHPSPLITRTG